jgi:hypothetical protein
LGFSFEGLSAEELKLFDGKGKTMAHIEVAERDALDEKRVVKLLEMVNRK